MGTILLFNVNKGKKKKIDIVAWKFKHEVKLVEKKDFAKPLGNLIGITVGQKADLIVESEAKTDMAEEMMVFSGLDSDALDAFLVAYKEAGLENIQMKAVVTQSNIFWTAEKLYEELAEHSKL